MTAATSTPWRSAATTYMATSTGAGALMVIEVLTALSGMSSKSSSMSRTEFDGDADLTDLAGAARIVAVEPHLGRQVERDREPGLSLGEQVAEARVGVGRRAVARVLADAPEAAAVHRRLDAARERRLAREALVAQRVVAGQIGGRVQRRNRDAAAGLELLLALAAPAGRARGAVPPTRAAPPAKSASPACTASGRRRLPTGDHRRSISRHLSGTNSPTCNTPLRWRCRSPAHSWRTPAPRSPATAGGTRHASCTTRPALARRPLRRTPPPTVRSAWACSSCSSASSSSASRSRSCSWCRLALRSCSPASSDGCAARPSPDVCSHSRSTSSRAGSATSNCPVSSDPAPHRSHALRHRSHRRSPSSATRQRRRPWWR